MKKDLRNSLLLGLGATVVGLVALESVIRLLDLAPQIAVIRRGRYQLSSNPKLGYVPVPDIDVPPGGLHDFFDYVGKSNSRGFRDVEHPVDRQPGTYRIVVLGDSIAAGYGVVRTEDTFPALLPRLLNRPGFKVEVISLAVSGYNTQQEVEILKAEGLRYEPDLVLVAYCLNDRESQVDGGIYLSLLATERGQSKIGRFLGHPLLNRSALYRFVRYRLGGRSHPPDLSEGDTVEPSITELGSLARAHRFDVLVVIFPEFIFPRKYEKRDQHHWIHHLAEKNGFYVLDLLRPMRKCYEAGEKNIRVDRTHPSAAGHRCAAVAAAHYVLTLNGIRARSHAP